MCVSPAETAEPIEIPFGGRLTRVGPTNLVLDGVEIFHEKGQFSCCGSSQPAFAHYYYNNNNSNNNNDDDNRHYS